MTGSAPALSYRFWSAAPAGHRGYRPDIDGLRAVAVLAVVAYHAFPRWSMGGFVGVDIFFVISGFLITGIILNGLQKETFSYADFYVRRIRRIFPPLSLVLLAALAGGWFVLFEDEYRLLGKHVAAGVAFVSNFILLREGGYFDVAAEFKPLLHLWSLAIEEQFYLVWPVLLVWASRRANAIGMIGVLAALSFAVNIWLIETRPHYYAFYISPARFWELMMGSALACVVHAGSGGSASSGRFVKWCSDRLAGGSRRVRNGAAAVGGMLIVFAIFSFDESIAFPGWWALIPTVGTFLIIAAGSDAWLNRVVLSNQAMVSIGLISYPLYLWHWLALYFARILSNGEPAITAKAIAIGISVLLACLSFYYIEFPVRTAPRGGRIAVALCLTMAAIGVAGVAGYLNAISTRPPDEWQQIAWARYDRNAPRSWDHGRTLRPYYLGDTARPEILFFGDSHMETYYPRIRRIIEEFSPAENGVAFATAGGCPPLPGVDRLDSAQPLGCSDFFTQTVEYARKMGFRKIVLAAYWDGYFLGLHHGDVKGPVLYASDDPQKRPILPGTDEFRKVFAALQDELSYFVRNGVEVYIVLPAPSSRVLDPSQILTRFDRLQFGPQPLPGEMHIDRRSFDQYVAPLNRAFRELSDQTGVQLIDPVPYICRSGKCSNMKDGRAIYTDDNHLTGYYVRNYATYIDTVFELQQGP